MVDRQALPQDPMKSLMIMTEVWFMRRKHVTLYSNSHSLTILDPSQYFRTYHSMRTMDEVGWNDRSNINVSPPKDDEAKVQTAVRRGDLRTEDSITCN